MDSADALDFLRRSVRDVPQEINQDDVFASLLCGLPRLDDDGVHLRFPAWLAGWVRKQNSTFFEMILILI